MKTCTLQLPLSANNIVSAGEDASVGLCMIKYCTHTTSLLPGNRIMITIATSSDSSRMFLIAYQV